MAKKQGLGRGLSALLGDTAVKTALADAGAAQEAVGDEVIRSQRVVPIELLRPNAYQPRLHFNDEKARELVESVREKGILQPILVRPDPKAAGKFEIIAGERRWRAAQEANLHQVPVVIKDFDDQESLEVALIENIQRHDLNPVEEAKGYRRLMDEFSHTQEQLGQIIGKSRSHIANILRLLGLPEKVQTLLGEGLLSMGHARALITASNPVSLAEKIVAEGLSVRQTEILARHEKLPDSGKGNKPAAGAKKGLDKDPDTLALEQDLATATGLKVEVEFAADESGKVIIHYQSLDQLDDLCRLLSQDKS